MKKKGLIISTIVMVVVLIASLTTATYAWFSTSASATISPMNIQTIASEGLQIGSVVYSESAVPAVYSGDLTLNEQHHWVAADENSFGSQLNLTISGSSTANPVLIQNMLGASGDGVTMFSQKENNALPSNTNYMVRAVENVNYLALDFALLATSAGTPYINQIYVDPTSYLTKSGMAGSMRVALFTKAPQANATTGTKTWTVASDGKILYEPYGGLTYTGSLFKAEAEGTNYYTAAGSDGNIGTKTTGASTLQALWTDSKVVYGTSTATTTKQLQAVGNQTANTTVEAARTAIKNLSNESVAELAHMAANDIMYCRLVVWFDGESKACTQEFAGGGALVTINFSLNPDSSNNSNP